MLSGENAHTKDGEVYQWSMSSLLSIKIEGSQSLVLVCWLAEPAVIAYNPTFASPVQWDQADQLAVLRPLWRPQHNWTREQRTKYLN